MSLPTYNTFAEKDAVFAREQIDEFEVLLKRLKNLKSDGYYFRGQSDAGWKLYTKIQRVWDDENLSEKFATAADFNEQHLIYQQKHAADELNVHTKQRNDLADSSALQHYGAPTPFLDFTFEIDAALFFATDGKNPPSCNETSQRFSIYAWKPGDGPATSSHNDMTNWETVLDDSGGIDGAVSLRVLSPLSVIYIKQDSGKFLQIANDRVDLQRGLFVYSPKAIREGMPYETLFTGQTSESVFIKAEDEGSATDNPSNVSATGTPELDALMKMCDEQTAKTQPGLNIPKMVCLDVDRSIASEVLHYLRHKGVSKESLGLASDHWAKEFYYEFLKSIVG